MSTSDSTITRTQRIEFRSLSGNDAFPQLPRFDVPDDGTAFEAPENERMPDGELHVWNNAITEIAAIGRPTSEAVLPDTDIRS